MQSALCTAGSRSILVSCSPRSLPSAQLCSPAHLLPAPWQHQSCYLPGSKLSPTKLCSLVSTSAGSNVASQVGPGLAEWGGVCISTMRLRNTASPGLLLRKTQGCVEMEVVAPAEPATLGTFVLQALGDVTAAATIWHCSTERRGAPAIIRTQKGTRLGWPRCNSSLS